MENLQIPEDKRKTVQVITTTAWNYELIKEIADSPDHPQRKLARALWESLHDSGAITIKRIESVEIKKGREI